MPVLQKLLEEKTIHLIFMISLIFKGMIALTEIVGGVLIFFISQQFLLKLVLAITQDELSEDPNDFVAHYLIHSARALSIGSQHFAAIYLLSHGVIKMFLIAGLLRERLWYYPTAIVVFGLFIVYQLYRYTFTHSPWLLILTVIDLAVIWLTWHELKYLSRKMAA